MTNRLYVGNLTSHASEDLIRQHFATCGEVKSVSVMMDRNSGHSRGFAFVEMATVDAAQKAISELDGKELLGRFLRVDIAADRRGDEPGGRRSG